MLVGYKQGTPITDPVTGVERIHRGIDWIANKYSRCGYRFLPLVREDWGIACSLDILFLRRDGPGSLIKSGGDIDNRIKVLFDALRIPRETQEIPSGDKPTDDEDPFYCLLEDDTLVNQVSITTDRLLLPMESGEAIHDVMLIIRVKTIVVDTTRAFRDFD